MHNALTPFRVSFCCTQAPELLAVEPISFKTDVFSFAIVFWELLTCRAPFVRVPKPSSVVAAAASPPSLSRATSAMPARRSSDVALVALSRSLDSRGEGESFLALNFASTTSIGGGASGGASGSVRRPRSSVFSSAASSTRERNLSAISNGSAVLPSSLGSHSNGNSLSLASESSPLDSSVSADQGASSALSAPADAPHAVDGTTPDHRRVSTIAEGPDSAAGAATSTAVVDGEERVAKPASVRAPVSIRAASAAGPLMLPIDDYDSDDVFVTNVTVARALVEEQGLRPPLPRDAPADLLDLLQQCWQRDPDKRPSFDTIVTQLERFLIATDVTRAFAAYPFSTDR